MKAFSSCAGSRNTVGAVWCPAMKIFALVATAGSSPASVSGRAGSAPMWKRWSTREWPATSAAFSRTASAVSAGGLVLGMSSTVVTPPATAALLPCSQSSLYVRPGVRKCTWESMRPGMT